MTKVCILCALFLLQQGTRPVPGPPKPPITEQKSPDADQKKTGATKQGTNSSSGISKSDTTPNPTDQNTSHVTSRNEKSSVRVISLPPVTIERDIPTFVISVVLAIIGIVGIIVGVCTLLTIQKQTRATKDAAEAAADSVRAIRDQTAHIARQALSMRRQTTILRDSLKAAKDSADAAKVGADAAKANIKVLLDSERAWVDVWLHQMGPAIYNLEIRNCGKTVAMITEWSVNPKTYPVPPDGVPEAKDIFTSDGGTVVRRSKLLAPDETPWTADSYNLVAIFGEEQLNRFATRAMGLVYWGIMRYENIAGQPHETYFCYWFNPGTRTLRPVEYPEYNKHT